MRPFLNVTKALADESRVRILLALRDGERCVCQLIELLGLAPSTVSKHMAILVQADLVRFRKAGRWHYYRRPEAQEASPLVHDALGWMDAAVGGTAQAAADQQRLAALALNTPAKGSPCCDRD